MKNKNKNKKLVLNYYAINMCTCTRKVTRTASDQIQLRVVGFDLLHFSQPTQAQHTGMSSARSVTEPNYQPRR